MKQIPNKNDIQKVADLHLKFNINSCVQILTFKDKKIFDHGVHAGIDFSMKIINTRNSNCKKQLNQTILSKKNELVELALISPHKIKPLYQTSFLQDLTDIDTSHAFPSLFLMPNPQCMRRFHTART